MFAVAFLLILPARAAHAAYARSLALARDPGGNFWSAAYDANSRPGTDYRVEKHDFAGVFLSSTPLPFAVEEGSFGFAFDASGNAWLLTKPIQAIKGTAENSCPKMTVPFPLNPVTIGTATNLHIGVN